MNRLDRSIRQAQNPIMKRDWVRYDASGYGLSRLTIALACFTMVLAFSSCSPNNRIVGVWQPEDESTPRFLEFRQDGEYIQTTITSVITGKYQRLGRDRVQLHYKSLDRDGKTVTNDWNCTLTVRGGVLELNYLPNTDEESNSVRFVRATATNANSYVDREFIGRELVRLPATASEEEIISLLFQKASSPPYYGVTNYTIVQALLVITSSGYQTEVELNTNLGRRWVSLQFDRQRFGGEPLRGWWCEMREPAGSPGNEPEGFEFPRTNSVSFP